MAEKLSSSSAATDSKVTVESESKVEDAAPELEVIPEPVAEVKASVPKPAAPEPEPQDYVVLHGVVGNWECGEVVTAKDINKRGLSEEEVERLVALGAFARREDAAVLAATYRHHRERGLN